MKESMHAGSGAARRGYAAVAIVWIGMVIEGGAARPPRRGSHGDGECKMAA